MLELTRRAQLGHLYDEAPVTFGDFAGLTLSDKDKVTLTGDGWFERYRTTVRPSTYDRRVDVIKHLHELVPLRIDRMTLGLVEDTTLTVQVKHPRQARLVHETIKM